MKIRENENILREDCTTEEYNKFYKLDEILDLKEDEDEEEYSKKYALNRVVELVRNINKEVTPNKIICPKEKEVEINSLFLTLYDWEFFSDELDYDEYMPNAEDVFDSSNTPQDKIEFIYKYYIHRYYEFGNKRVQFETVESLINKAKKDIEKTKKYVLENRPEEYEIHKIK